MRKNKHWGVLLWLFNSTLVIFCAEHETEKKDSAPTVPSWPVYTLSAEKHWQLDSGGKDFGASGLALLGSGDLLTVRDHGPEVYRIIFSADGKEAKLASLPDCFTASQVAPFGKEKHGYYDTEGIARDDQGRLYICEETDRWILRWDPKTKKVERLQIDWTPVQKYFDPKDRNASFEGIAVGDGKLFIANERQQARLIVVDLATLKIVDDFTVSPSHPIIFGLQYSDLSWFNHELFMLMREDRLLLKINPSTHVVLAEYQYRAMEHDPEVDYEPLFSFYQTGFMEGLAVDADFFWLVTDNNGKARKKYPRDTRPTLFKCRRPDK